MPKTSFLRLLCQSGRAVQFGWILLAIFLSSLTASHADAQQPTTWKLIAPSTKSITQTPHSHRIQFDAESLDGWGENELGLIELPKGQLSPIQKTSRVDHESGNRTFVGKIRSDGHTYTSVFTYGSAGIVGEIRTANGTYVLETVDGEPLLTDVDAAGWRPGPYRDDARAPAASVVETPPESPDRVDKSSLKAVEAAPTPQTTIDVLVAYSHAMVTRAGSVAGAQLRIDQLIAITNQAYVDSEVAVTLRLVHALEVSYSETTDNDVALDDLTAGSGVLAGPATTLRNRYGADIVALVRPFNYPSQSGCGIAWVGGYGGNGGSIGSQSNNGFAVISDGSDVNGSGYYCFNASFAHELGHNMGAMHDRGTVTQGGTLALQTGAYSYSYGYVHNATFSTTYGVNVCNAGAGSTCFGTIMSYINAVPEPRFSNPSVFTCTQSQVCGTTTDNVALTLNNTRAGVASWKATKVPFVGTTSGSGQGATINSPFALQLQVVLRDATGQLVPGVNVVFAAPSSGASASLSAQSVTTDANGSAKVTATANGVAGSYVVTATATSGLVAAPFSFNLTNASSTNLLTVQVVGPGTVSGTGINCPSTCSSFSAQGSTVTLTATASSNNTFMGWLGACTGTGTCTVSTSIPVTVSATFASSSLLPVRVDIDASTKYDALTDGQLILRFLRGFTGNALTAGALGSGAARIDSTAVATYLQNILPRLDIDGNGKVDAATDGLLVTRYLMGFRGNALIANAVGTGAIRTTATAIEQVLAALLP